MFFKICVKVQILKLNKEVLILIFVIQLKIMNERIKKLLLYLEEDGNDPFVLYALANEFKQYDLEKAKYYYDILLDKHENYVGTYYHAAALYDLMLEKEKAKQIYEKGLKIALDLNEHHAYNELKTSFNKFLGLDYDDEV